MLGWWKIDDTQCGMINFPVMRQIIDVADGTGQV